MVFAPALETSPPVSYFLQTFLLKMVTSTPFFLQAKKKFDFFIFFSFTGIITYFVPCYTFGKNAEQLGENCLTYGLSQLVPILDIWCRTQVRGKIREQKGIEGTCIKDLVMHLFCGLCALIQEARVSLFFVLFLLSNFTHAFCQLLKLCRWFTALSPFLFSLYRNWKDQRPRAWSVNRLP